MRRQSLLSLLAIFFLLASPLHVAAQSPEQALQGTINLDRKAYLTLGAADFHPPSFEVNYENHGRYLKVFSTQVGLVPIFSASINLPTGSTITKMTLHFRDNVFNAEKIKLNLRYRASVDGSMTTAAVLSSTQTGVTPSAPYFYQVSTGNINVRYTAMNAYFIEAEMPLSATNETDINWLCGVTLEYTLPDQLANPEAHAIAPAVMMPYKDGYSYSLSEGTLRHIRNTKDAADTRGVYLMRLSLPQGASIYNLAMLYSNYSGKTGTVRLQTSDPSLGNFTDIASLTTTTTSFDHKTVYQDISTQPKVDNSKNSYWLTLDLPMSSGDSYFDAQAVFVYYLLPTTAVPTPTSAYLSAAAFTPFRYWYRYENHGRYLRHVETQLTYPESPNGWYMTPLNLPNGAVITGMTLNAYDTLAGKAGMVTLERSRLDTGNYEALLSLSTQNDSGFQAKDGTLNTPITVDMKNYSYWIVADLPPSTATGAAATNDLLLQGVRVKYDYTFTRLYHTYLPSLSKP